MGKDFAKIEKFLKELRKREVANPKVAKTVLAKPPAKSFKQQNLSKLEYRNGCIHIQTGLLYSHLRKEAELGPV